MEEKKYDPSGFNNNNNNNNNNNPHSHPQHQVVEDEWRNLLESSNLIPSSTTSRIHRSFKGIEKEAQRLSSKQSKHIPANELKDFAAQIGVDIRGQSQYISSIDSLSTSKPSNQYKKRGDQQQQAIPNKLLFDEDHRSIPLISGSIRPSSTMDLNNFLKWHHEYVISSTIQECQLLSSRYFRKKYINSMEEEWNCTKNDILNTLGFKKDDDMKLNLNQTQNNHNNNSTLNQTHTNHGNGMNIDDNLNDNNNNNENLLFSSQFEDSLNQILCQLCESRILSLPIQDVNRNPHSGQCTVRDNIFNPLNKICALHREFMNEFTNNHQINHANNILLEFRLFNDLWNCLNSMLYGGVGLDAYIKENQFKDALSNNNIGLQRLFISGARIYLEQEYSDNIKKIVRANKYEAKIGGKPGMQHTIRAFVGLKYNKSIPSSMICISIDNLQLPLWPLIYFSYRCGEIDSAIYYSSRHPSAKPIEACLKDLRENSLKFNNQFNFLRSDIDNNYSDIENKMKLYSTFDPSQLNSDLWNELNSQYQNILQTGMEDPFEMTMYLLIGKFFYNSNNVDINLVIEVQEDVLWYKLVTTIYSREELPNWLALSDDETNIYSPSLICDLQNMVQSFPPNQFDHGILFITSLLMTQEFDLAFEYMVKQYKLQGIQLGIYFNYYGLFSSSQTKKNLLKYILSFIKQKNYKSLSPCMVFFYLLIIGEIDELSYFLSEPNKLLREILIGRITSNNLIDISSGLISKYCSHEEFERITTSSAREANNSGEIEHCIILYILCGNYDEAAKMIIKLLASHIQDKPYNHSKEYIVKLAKNLYLFNTKDETYHSLGNNLSRITPKNQKNLAVAIIFADFYDQFYKINNNKNQFLNLTQILQIFNQQQNNILPITDDLLYADNITINDRLQKCKNNILSLNKNVQKYVPQIIVDCMQILSLKFDNLISLNQDIQKNKMSQDNLKNISRKCYILYNFYNNLESHIKPIGAGNTSKQISNLFFKTRID